MKRVALFLFALATSCTTAATSDSTSSTSSDATRVFGVAKSSSVNPKTIAGVWEATAPQTQSTLSSLSRFEFRATFVVAAARCTMDGAQPVIVGGRASANVSDDLVVINENIEDTKQIGGNALCGVQTAAGQLPVCSDPPPTNGVCFALTGTGLDLHQGATVQSFTKIAD